MRKQVEEYIREARQSIWELRFSRTQRGDLVVALRDIGEHATASGSARFELTAHGEPRTVGSNVEEQLLRIGQEAVNNAVRHSGARTIHAQLHYGDRSLALHVIDDGCGFDVAAATDAAEGHYGLITMRERAKEIRADLDVTSQPNRGTMVRALVEYQGIR
jgi:signal transduction histidine kinase